MLADRLPGIEDLAHSLLEVRGGRFELQLQTLALAARGAKQPVRHARSAADVPLLCVDVVPVGDLTLEVQDAQPLLERVVVDLP